MPRPILLAAALVAAVAATPLAIGRGVPAALVVTDAAGALLWRVPVADGTAVVLQYTNSIYLAPTWERFVVRQDRLHLLDVSSTREAVLEYHRLPPPYLREGPRLVASVAGVVLDGYTLRIGERGRPTLQVGSKTLPLYQAGVGAALRVAVWRGPGLLLWLRG